MPWFAKDWRETPFGSAGHLCLSDPCPWDAPHRWKALAPASLPFRRHVVSAPTHGPTHSNQLAPPWPTTPTCPGLLRQSMPWPPPRPFLLKSQWLQSLSSCLPLTYSRFCELFCDCSTILWTTILWTILLRLEGLGYFINTSSLINFFIRMIHFDIWQN